MNIKNKIMLTSVAALSAALLSTTALPVVHALDTAVVSTQSNTEINESNFTIDNLYKSTTLSKEVKVLVKYFKIDEKALVSKALTVGKNDIDTYNKNEKDFEAKDSTYKANVRTFDQHAALESVVSELKKEVKAKGEAQKQNALVELFFSTIGHEQSIYTYQNQIAGKDEIYTQIGGTVDEAKANLAQTQTQLKNDTVKFDKLLLSVVKASSLDNYLSGKTLAPVHHVAPKPVVHKITVKEQFGRHVKVAGSGNALNNVKLRLNTRGYHYHGNVKVSVRGRNVKLTGVVADRHYKVRSIKVTKDRRGNFTAVILVAKR